jgi:hypothetical protein
MRRRQTPLGAAPPRVVVAGVSNRHVDRQGMSGSANARRHRWLDDAGTSHQQQKRGAALIMVRPLSVQSQLLSEAQLGASSLARSTEALGATAPGPSTPLDRAIDALHRYEARAALEAIEGALARLDAGTYGASVAWDRPIPDGSTHGGGGAR